MGLDFTEIADRTGAACYVLHQGLMTDARRFESLREDIQSRIKHQVVLVNVKSRDGEKIRDFYDIPKESLPVVLLIRDDDTIHSMWSGTEIPTADVIAYNLQQISA